VSFPLFVDFRLYHQYAAGERAWMYLVILFELSRVNLHGGDGQSSAVGNARRFSVVISRVMLSSVRLANSWHGVYGTMSHIG
jgi:hypothetical protein